MTAKLPNSVQQIADVIGREKALELVGKLPRMNPPSRSKGETQVCVYIPMLCNLKPDHKLAKMIGYKAAEKLSLRFGSEILHLATCRDLYRSFRNDAIIRMIEEEIPEELVAEWMGVSTRTVSMVVRRKGIVDRLYRKGGERKR